MLVYAADKRQFLEHVRSSEIDDLIILAMQDKGLGKVSASEIASWRNSMKYMMAILMENGIPDNRATIRSGVWPELKAAANPAEIRDD